MTARRDSSDEPSYGSLAGRVLLGGAVVLALAATGVMVLSEQQQWLRLGIVAALWAALTGAFIAARYRKQLADREEDAQDRQAMYELELEREVAARREYELEVQAETRRQVEEESRDDIAAVRQELQGLRQTLESLMGGEFLVERYALRAESTRMRSLPDESARKNLKRLPAAQVPAVIQEAETDLIERVVSEPRRPEPVAEEPSLPRRGARAARTDWPRPDAGVPPETKAELSDRWFVPGALTGDQAEAAPDTAAAGGRRRAETQQPDEPRETWAGALDADDWAPSWESGRSAARTAAKSNGTDAAEEPMAALWRKEPTPHRYADPPSETGKEPVNGRYADPPSDVGLPASRYVDPVSGTGHEPVNRRYVDPPSDVGQPAVSRYVDPMSGTGQPAANRRYADPPSGVGQPAASGYVDPVSGTGHEPVNRRYVDPPSDVGQPAGYRDPAAGTGYEPAGTRYVDPSSDIGQPAGYRDPLSGFADPPSGNYVDPAAEVEAQPLRERPYVTPGGGKRSADRYVDPESGYSNSGSRYAEPASANGYVDPASGYSEANGHEQSAARRYADPESGYSDPPSGRRHAVDQVNGDASGGGRRRRADDAPTWQESLQQNHNGGHSRPDPDEPVDQPTGTHAAGRSVTELLATHGGNPNGPRRRRRRED